MTRQRMLRGFSAIELLVVVAILATLAALVLPRIGSAGDGYRADMAARRIAADLNYARGQARLTSRAVSVEFNTGAHSYTFPNLPGPDRSSEAYSVCVARPPFEAVLKTVDLGGKTTVTFSAFGAPDVGGQIQVSCGGASRTVLVNANTGEASVP